MGAFNISWTHIRSGVKLDFGLIGDLRAEKIMGSRSHGRLTCFVNPDFTPDLFDPGQIDS